jgi:hypothetical protein
MRFISAAAALPPPISFAMRQLITCRASTPARQRSKDSRSSDGCFLDTRPSLHHESFALVGGKRQETNHLTKPVSNCDFAAGGTVASENADSHLDQDVAAHNPAQIIWLPSGGRGAPPLPVCAAQNNRPKPRIRPVIHIPNSSTIERAP